VTEQRWAAVDEYLTGLFVAPDSALEAAFEPGSVSPVHGKLLHLLARLAGVQAILELGTLGGYSTIWLARALPPGGRLVTLESDAARAQLARANIGRAGVADVVEILVGPALETLPRLSGPFDLVFLDADKERNAEYLPWALRLCRPGSLIVADNVVRGGAVIDAGSSDQRVQGIRRFNELLAAEPRVSATTIQTVGSKGYDGFAVALVTGEGR
jgi:predicted O-methyltransferase YrrM